MDVKLSWDAGFLRTAKRLKREKNEQVPPNWCACLAFRARNPAAKSLS
jgi:hypothetical protein